MRHTRASLMVVASLTATTLTACTALPDPGPVADELAAGLSAGDLDAVPFAGTAAAQASAELAEVVAGLGPATRQVEVVAVEPVDGPDGSRQAEVELAYTWDLDGPGPAEAGWGYPVAATLRYDDEAGAWQALWARSLVHPDLGADETLVAERVQPPRAEVLGAGGTPLVVDRDVERVGLDKVRLGDADPDAAARALAGVVGVDPDGYAERVVDAGDEAFVEAIVLRSADAEPVRAAVEAVPGGRLLPDTLPLAPTREFARALLGTVGTATAELVEASDGAVAAGDVVGLSGLQATYDEQLRGWPGFTVRIRDTEGARGDALVSEGPVPGDPLQLTLDPRLQQLADDELADVGPPSALVALRPSDGQVLAVASGPGGGGYSTATLGRYAPGSVFKLVTSLALLRAGLTEQSPLACTAQVDVDGKVFGNYSGYPASSLGEIPLVEAFAQSCNTAFVSQVDLLDDEDLSVAAGSLGLGGWPDIGVEAFPGSLGDPPTRVDRAASLIGQGPVLLSPLAAAAMAASTSGRVVVPWLVGDDPPAVAPNDPAGPQEAAVLLAMMRAAVTSGTAGVVADVPGAPVAAKTGTAEFGTGTPPDTHGWVVAVQGDLAVAVFVESEASGAGTAGPILASFLTAAARTG